MGGAGAPESLIKCYSPWSPVLCWGFLRVGGQGPRIPASFMGQSSRKTLGGAGLELLQEEVES